MRFDSRFIKALLIGMITLWLSGCTDHYEHVNGECVNGTDSTAIIQVVYDSLAPANSSPNATATYKYVEDGILGPSCTDDGNEISAGLSGANFPAKLYSVATSDIDYAGCRYSFAAPHECKDGTIIATAVDIPEDDAALSSLTLNSGNLSPGFTVVKNAYAVTVPYETRTIRVTPTVRTSGATVKVNNQAVTSGSASQLLWLNDGSNAINIVVTSSNGKKTYTYSVVVQRSLSSNAYLSYIMTEGALEPGFNKDIMNYSMTLSADKDKLALRVMADELDGSTKVALNGIQLRYDSLYDFYKLDNYPLTIGANILSIVATAPDGVTTKTYTLNVIRGHVLSTDANLSGLTLNSGTLSPTFSSAVTSYTATVPNATTSIQVTPTVSETHATVKVNGITTTSGSASSSIDLAVGQNSIPVVVTAEDGTTTKTYTVNVTRQTAVNANLSNLVPSVGALSPSFASGTYNYALSIPGQNSLTVTPTAEYPGNVMIRVNGVITASGQASEVIPIPPDGSTIEILVIPPNVGDTRYYVINVTR